MHSPEKALAAPGSSMRPQPASRASQFMPFAALKGYYELIRERDRMPEPFREPNEEEAAELSRRMARIRRGSAVHVRHHDGEAYVVSAGTVTGIDLARRTVSVGRTTIPFDRIAGIALDEEGEGV